MPQPQKAVPSQGSRECRHEVISSLYWLENPLTRKPVKEILMMGTLITPEMTEQTQWEPNCSLVRAREIRQQKGQQRPVCRSGHWEYQTQLAQQYKQVYWDWTKSSQCLNGLTLNTLTEKFNTLVYQEMGTYQIFYSSACVCMCVLMCICVCQCECKCYNEHVEEIRR